MPPELTQAFAIAAATWIACTLGLLVVVALAWLVAESFARGKHENDEADRLARIIEEAMRKDKKDE